jgi:hypothetical protein
MIGVDHRSLLGFCLASARRSQADGQPQLSGSAAAEAVPAPIETLV